MATRTTALFSGNGWLECPHNVSLNVSGDLYASFWFKPNAGFDGKAIVSKSSTLWTNSSFLISAEAVTGKILWFCWDTVTPLLPPAIAVGPAMTAGVWYFVEAFYDASDLIAGVTATPASGSPGSFFTAAMDGPLANSTVSFTVGGLVTGDRTFGEIHSLLLATEIPHQSDPLARENLFAAGAGASYWQIDDSRFRNSIIAAWDMSEASGTRFDLAGREINLSVNGTVGAASRAFVLTADHAAYGPIRHLADLIAQCPAFQAMVGVPTKSQALSKVFYSEVSDISGANGRPWACVSVDAADTETQTGTFSSGTASVLLEAPVMGGQDTFEARIIFENFVGKIVEEMQVRERLGGNIVVRTIDMKVPLAIANKSERGVPLYYSAALRIEYGLGG